MTEFYKMNKKKINTFFFHEILEFWIYLVARVSITSMPRPTLNLVRLQILLLRNVNKDCADDYNCKSKWVLSILLSNLLSLLSIPPSIPLSMPLRLPPSLPPSLPLGIQLRKSAISHAMKVFRFLSFDKLGWSMKLLQNYFTIYHLIKLKEWFIKAILHLRSAQVDLPLSLMSSPMSLWSLYVLPATIVIFSGHNCILNILCVHERMCQNDLLLQLWDMLM